MGIPTVQSPSEAESQCAELCKAGKVYAVATEDMDALTFGSPITLRHVTLSEARAKKTPIEEYNLQEILQGLDVTMDQFIDICILCGCDYCPTIRGIGPKKAYQLIKEYKNIEGVLEHIKHNKSYVVPEEFPYKAARELFKNPIVIPASQIELKWEEPGLFDRL